MAHTNTPLVDCPTKAKEQNRDSFISIAADIPKDAPPPPPISQTQLLYLREHLEQERDRREKIQDALTVFLYDSNLERKRCALEIMSSLVYNDGNDYFRPFALVCNHYCSSAFSQRDNLLLLPETENEIRKCQGNIVEHAKAIAAKWSKGPIKSPFWISSEWVVMFSLWYCLHKALISPSSDTPTIEVCRNMLQADSVVYAGVLTFPLHPWSLPDADHE